nr:hypothetical protein [uncultured Sphingomonas sp.]
MNKSESVSSHIDLAALKSGRSLLAKTFPKSQKSRDAAAHPELYVDAGAKHQAEFSGSGSPVAGSITMSNTIIGDDVVFTWKGQVYHTGLGVETLSSIRDGVNLCLSSMSKLNHNLLR